MHRLPPRPAREGIYVEHQFEFDSTGFSAKKRRGQAQL